MATEDLSGYTEVDPDGKISVTSSRVTGTDINRSLRDYLYKDFGAGGINGFNLNFTICVTEISANDIAAGPGFANEVGDVSAWGSDHIRVTSYFPSGQAFRFYLGSNYWAANANTVYYCNLSRPANGDTVTLKIYSDSNRQTLLTTITLTISTSTTWRYFYPLSSQYTNHAYGCNLYLENFEFITSGGQSVVPLCMSHYRRRRA